MTSTHSQPLNAHLHQPNVNAAAQNKKGNQCRIEIWYVKCCFYIMMYFAHVLE